MLCLQLKQKKKIIGINSISSLQTEKHDKIFHSEILKTILDNFEIFQHPLFAIFYETVDIHYEVTENY